MLDESVPEKLSQPNAIEDKVVSTIHTDASKFPSVVMENSSPIKASIISEIGKQITKKIENKDLKYQSYLMFNIKEQSTYEIITKYLSSLATPFGMYENHLILESEDSVLYMYGSGDLFSTMVSFGIDIFSSSLEKLKSSVESLKKVLSPITTRENYSIDISWFYSTRNGVDSIRLSDEVSDVFLDEAYPYMDIDNLTKTYSEATEPILVLIGPPGTGKTRLIRYILNAACIHKKSDLGVIFTSDQAIIQSGELFINFLSSNKNFMVLEDIDYHLTPRKDGNTSMYNFLSISNGLAVSLQKHKKIILSTNLTSVSNIDQALLRPGRCFSVIETRELSYTESNALLDKLGKSKDLKPECTYSLADLYNEKEQIRKCRKPGFI